MTTELNAKGEEVVVVFTPFITRGGKRIFKKDGGYYRLEIPKDKYKPR